MSGKFVIQQKKSTVGSALLFLLLIGWRFFLGLPMNGKRTDNATFLKGATRGKPGKVLTRWRKKPYIHRAAIRHSAFWPIAMLFVLFIVNRTIALLVCAFISFPAAWIAFRKGRLIFFDPFASTDVDGIRHQHWGLKNKYRKLLHRQPIPGLVTRKTKFDETLPKELQDAVRASLNMNEFKGLMPVLKVTRYRRKSIKRADR